jgi:hypothetical protein
MLIITSPPQVPSFNESVLERKLDTAHAFDARQLLTFETVENHHRQGYRCLMPTSWKLFPYSSSRRAKFLQQGKFLNFSAQERKNNKTSSLFGNKFLLCLYLAQGF